MPMLRSVAFAVCGALTCSMAGGAIGAHAQAAPSSAQAVVTDTVTTGRWYFWGGRDENPWRPNAAQFPAMFGTGNETWTVHPALRTKLRRLVDLFIAAEPKPAYAHHQIGVAPGARLEPGKPQSRVIVTLGDQLWLYDAQGRLLPNRTPPGGFLPFALGHVHINGSSSPNYGLGRLFPYARELSQSSSSRDSVLPTGRLYVVPPRRTGETAALMSLLGREAQGDQPEPANLGDQIFVTSVTQAIHGGQAQSQYVETSYTLFISLGGQLPVGEFITRGELLDIITTKEKARLESVRRGLEARTMPDDPRRRDTEVRYRQRMIAQEELGTRVLDRLREVYAATLGQVAIVHPDFFTAALAASPFVWGEEEFVSSVGRRSARKYPLDRLFLDDASQGYRFGRRDPRLYAGMKDGEIRSIQFDFTIPRRLPGQPGHGRPNEPGAITRWGDAPGNIRHALLHRFDWAAVQALLGG